MTAERTIPRPRAHIDNMLAGRTPPDQVEIISRELRTELTSASVDWVFTLADLADRNQLAPSVLRQCAAGLAWAARECGQRMPDDDDWRRCTDAANPTIARRTLAYVHGNRLRADFRFDDLAVASRRWLADLPDDAFLHSLAAFAALGQRSDRSLPLLAQASALPDYDGSCRGACLQGLWFGTQLPDQADRILAMSDEMIGRGEDGANLYYWRAFALRQTGQFDTALASIDQAIALLPVGMNAVHQDYVRERELITTTRLLNQQVRALTDQLSAALRGQFQQHRDEIQQEVEQHAATARRLISESLLGIVEVLALFVTLAGFLIGSGALVLRADGFGQSLGAIALLAVGAISFFALLRIVVRFDRRRPHPWPSLRRTSKPPD